MSVFRPVDTQLYQVVYWYPEQPETPLIVKTPSPNVYSSENSNKQKEESYMKPKRVKVIQKDSKKEKKFWTIEEKVFAIRKAQMIGISKALRLLQNEYSDVYSELSPSTIQYWVSKCKHLVEN